MYPTVIRVLINNKHNCFYCTANKSGRDYLLQLICMRSSYGIFAFEPIKSSHFFQRRNQTKKTHTHSIISFHSSLILLSSLSALFLLFLSLSFSLSLSRSQFPSLSFFLCFSLSSHLSLSLLLFLSLCLDRLPLALPLSSACVFHSIQPKIKM